MNLIAKIDVLARTPCACMVTGKETYFTTDAKNVLAFARSWTKTHEKIAWWCFEYKGRAVFIAPSKIARFRTKPRVPTPEEAAKLREKIEAAAAKKLDWWMRRNHPEDYTTIDISKFRYVPDDAALRKWMQTKYVHSYHWLNRYLRHATKEEWIAWKAMTDEEKRAFVDQYRNHYPGPDWEEQERRAIEEAWEKENDFKIHWRSKK